MSSTDTKIKQQKTENVENSHNETVQAEKITNNSQDDLKNSNQTATNNNSNLQNSAMLTAMNIVKNVIHDSNMSGSNKQSNYQDLNNNNNVQVKNFSLNYSAVTNNPITAFHDHIENTINVVLEDYFKVKFVNRQTEMQEISEFTSEIKKAEQEIIDKKQETRYTSRMWKHCLYILMFCLLFGFFFLKKYKANKKVINEFRNFRNEKNAYIQKMTNNRFSLMSAALSTVTLRDLLRYCFSRYGIRTSELIPATKILTFLNNANNIDVQIGIYGTYKNSPFFDTIVRSLEWRDVVTSRSQSFPYTAIESFVDANGRRSTRRVIRYETLTAYHHENTPFIEKENVLIFLTNFEPDLKFWNNNKKRNKSILLENDDFLKAYKINVEGDIKNDVAIAQKLGQYFTIKAQEDYLQWYLKNNKSVLDFYKIKYAITVFNNVYKYDTLYDLYNSIDNLNVLENRQDVDFEELKSRVKSYALSYFNRVTKMLQIPLLSPAINREWYRFDSNDYMIATSFGTNYDDVESESNLDHSYTINRFFDKKYIWFNDNKKITRSPWFKLDESKQSRNKVVHSTYNMNSFWSRHLIDCVPVVGIHVGLKYINVPYEKFYPLREKKYLAHLFFNNKTKTKIIVSPNNKNLIHSDYYANKDFADMMLNGGVWTNNPSWLEKFSNRDQLLQILQKFYSINENGQQVLVVDPYGAYVLSNQSTTDTEVVDNILLEIAKLFK